MNSRRGKHDSKIPCQFFQARAACSFPQAQNSHIGPACARFERRHGVGCGHPEIIMGVDGNLAGVQHLLDVCHHRNHSRRGGVPYGVGQPDTEGPGLFRQTGHVRKENGVRPCCILETDGDLQAHLQGGANCIQHGPLGPEAVLAQPFYQMQVGYGDGQGQAIGGEGRCSENVLLFTSAPERGLQVRVMSFAEGHDFACLMRGVCISQAIFVPFYRDCPGPWRVVREKVAILAHWRISDCKISPAVFVPPVLRSLPSGNSL